MNMDLGDEEFSTKWSIHINDREREFWARKTWKLMKLLNWKAHRNSAIHTSKSTQTHILLFVTCNFETWVFKKKSWSYFYIRWDLSRKSDLNYLHQFTIPSRLSEGSLVTPHPCQHLVDLLVTAILAGVRWLLIAVDLHFLVLSDAKQYVLFIFMVSAHFLIRLFFLGWVVWVF